MPSEDASPSAGWREVYDAMGTEPDDGADLRADGRGDPRPGSDSDGRGERSLPEPCPDCGAVPGVDVGVRCEDRAGVARDCDG